MITTPITITNSEISAKESGNVPYLLITYTTSGVPTPSPSATPVPTVTITPVPAPNATTYISHIKRASGFYKVDGQTNATSITISIGDKVQWINDGVNTVTLVSKQNLWTAKSLTTGETYIYTFNTIGNYRVYLKGYTNKYQMIYVI